MLVFFPKHLTSKLDFKKNPRDHSLPNTCNVIKSNPK